MYRSAVISPCGKYRYSLSRKWEDDPAWMTFIMLNPSTADVLKDDPTIRRCLSFAKTYKCGGIVVVNLFAWRATNPNVLPTVRDPYGPRFYEHFEQGIIRKNYLVAAWGASKYVRTIHIRVLLSGRKLYCLGTTKDGYPKHPVRLAGSTKLQEFRL